MSGKLSIIGTPIGNLADITLRALETLQNVEVIFCEDTRVTKRLLERHGITTAVKSLNARTEQEKTTEVLSLLADGKHLAYVSDAGTPGISDPGSYLVSHARAKGFVVETIPGPSALTAALSIAGVPASEFLFLGFLPHKKGRQTLLKEIAASKRAVVVYESTHRIVKLLTELQQYTPINRSMCLGRELTKIHEEILCGSAEELLRILTQQPQKQKGEFVVIITPLQKSVL